MRLEQTVQWNGDEAIVYQVISGQYRPDNNMINPSVQAILGEHTDPACNPEAPNAASPEDLGRAQAKLQWQIVFPQNSHMALECDIWMNFTYFLERINRLPNASLNRVNDIHMA